MILLISGMNNWKDDEIVEKKFNEIKKLYPKSEKFELIQFGTIFGIDADVRKLGRKYNVVTHTYKAINLQDKFVRNSKVLSDHKINIIWLFCYNKPTNWMKDLIKKARRRRISVNIFNDFKKQDYKEPDDEQLSLF